MPSLRQQARTLLELPPLQQRVRNPKPALLTTRGEITKDNCVAHPIRECLLETPIAKQWIQDLEFSKHHIYAVLGMHSAEFYELADTRESGCKQTSIRTTLVSLLTACMSRQAARLVYKRQLPGQPSCCPCSSVWVGGTTVSDTCPCAGHP